MDTRREDMNDIPDPMGTEALQRFIDTREIDAQILTLDEHTATVADAARALKVDTDRIIKSLVFRCNDETLLVITNGLARVDRKKLAGIVGVGRKKVKFAAPEAALAITGYVVGSMPPFGHRAGLRTLVDRAVTRLDTVYGGGGGLDAMMRLAPAELLRVTRAEVVDVAQTESDKAAGA
jgi:Cys-tRNA(Pro) deacylase